MKITKSTLVLFKAKNHAIPEVGILQEFDNGEKEIYVPSYDDVQYLEDVEWQIELDPIIEKLKI